MISVNTNNLQIGLFSLYVEPFRVQVELGVIAVRGISHASDFKK